MKNLPNDEVQNLLNQISKGNDKAFEQLYSCLQPSVFKAVCFEYPQEPREDVHSAVDNAFLELQKPRHYNDLNHVVNSIKKIASSKMADLYRKTKKTNLREVKIADLSHSDDDNEASLFELIADHDDSPLEVLMKEELAEALLECINKIKSPNLREIAFLASEENDYQTISIIVGKEVGTIKSSMFSIKALLRTCMSRAYGMEKFE